jgi:hypothetical protein
VPSERFSEPAPTVVLDMRIDEDLSDQGLQLEIRGNQSCWVYRMNTGEDSVERGISGGEVHYCMPLGCHISEYECRHSPPVIRFIWDEELRSS